MRRSWYPLPRVTGGIYVLIVIVIHRCFPLFPWGWAMKSATCSDLLFQALLQHVWLYIVVLVYM